jgi:HTH-type transcriptional regulator/antitoxin HigA
MNIKPIKTKKDYRDSLAELKKLFHAKKGTPKGDRLEVLMVLIDDYENRHFPIDPPSAIEAIKFRMEQAGLNQIDLVPFIRGGRGRVSEILSGKRDLTLPMIRRLHAGLGIPLESLMNNGNNDTEHHRVATR